MFAQNNFGSRIATSDPKFQLGLSDIHSAGDEEEGAVGLDDCPEDILVQEDLFLS